MVLPPVSSPSMAKVRTPGDVSVDGMLTSPAALWGMPEARCCPPVGFYLISPSEFERFSLSARNVTEPLCRLEVARLQDTSCLRWAVPRVWGALLWWNPCRTHPMTLVLTMTSPCFLPATAQR